MTNSMLTLRGLLAGTSMLAISVLGITAAAAQDRDTGTLPIAVQMYTLRDSGTLDDQLAAVQAAGVTAVETVGMQDTDAETLKAALDKHGIAAISTHAQLADLRDNLDAVIAFNKAIGNTVLVVPFLKPEMRPTDAAGWAALGAELKTISDKVKAEGMTLAYHNHDFEMAQFDGRSALEIMMEAAGPDVLTELDLAEQQTHLRIIRVGLQMSLGSLLRLRPLQVTHHALHIGVAVGVSCGMQPQSQR